MEPDPRYPDRPQHKDFDRLSQLVLAQDDYALHNENLEDFLLPFVDVESLAYLAQNRAATVCNKALGTNVPGVLSEAFSDLIAGAIIDGFALGVRFEGD